MRVLVTTSPGLGHIFPTISLAWAFRAAGHEVLMATSGRSAGDIAAVVAAGLPVAEIASVEQITAARQALVAERRREARERGVSDEEMMRRNVATARQAKRVENRNGLAFTERIFGPLSAAALDGLVGVARSWRPDLVVYESMQGGGPLVAALLDVPAVEHPVGLSRGPELGDALRARLAGDYARYGVGPPRRTASLDVTPPSMGIGPQYGWPMRYVPYNGGGVFDGWREGPRGRPRIGVSISSSVPGQAGLDSLAPIIAAAREVDAEFVFTVGGNDPGRLGDLPANVRAHPYLPLTILLSGCDAVIHHGGAGSTLAALDAGVPQLILPYLGDSFINGEAVHKRGCGLVVEEGVPDVDTIGRLVSGELAASAREVADEMATMPPPVDLVPRLIALAA
jgi:UDP:flavonoid glycosyltransferase YjiC (YdhE family)